MRARLAQMAPWSILALGFGVFLVYAYPGYMSIDSALQLTEARSGVYSDWHPPAMAALWRFVEYFVSGPFVMLLLQSSAFLIGVYRLFCRQFAARTAALFAVGTLLLPPILAPMAVIWKDSQMAGYLVLGVSLVLDDRKRARWAGIAVLALASAMRDNAPAATLPLLAFGFAWRAGQAWWARIATGVAVWIAITGATMSLNRALTSQPAHLWHTAIATSDIAGVLEFSRRYSDEELLQILDGTPLVVHDKIFINARRNYTPVSWWRIANGPDRLFDWPTTDDQRTALARAWKTLVTANPLAYVYHRLHVFREVLGLGESPLFDPVFHTKIVDGYKASLHYDASPSHIQTALASVLEWFATHTFLFRAYVYLAIALVLLPLAWRHRDLRALLASGLCYELSFLPFAATPDVRYSHWLVTTTVIATVILVARRAAQSRTPARLLASTRTSSAEAITASAVASAAPSSPSAGISTS